MKDELGCTVCLYCTNKSSQCALQIDLPAYLRDARQLLKCSECKAFLLYFESCVEPEPTATLSMSLYVTHALFKCITVFLYWVKTRQGQLYVVYCPHTEAENQFQAKDMI